MIGVAVGATELQVTLLSELLWCYNGAGIFEAVYFSIIAILDIVHHHYQGFVPEIVTY